MPQPLPSQNMGIPIRRPVATQRPMAINPAMPVAQPAARPVAAARPVMPVRPAKRPVVAMKKGGSVEKLKKPIKRKSLKKVDRVKKPAFKEGGAVERFLAKYPDYKP